MRKYKLFSELHGTDRRFPLLDSGLRENYRFGRQIEGLGLADPADKERLAQLEKRIDELKGAHAPRSKIEEHHSQAHLAWRMVIELVTGLGIGFGIGYGLDEVFDTRPVFLVLFILLGFAAGVRVMLRSAKEVQDEKAGDTPGTDGDRTGGD